MIVQLRSRIIRCCTKCRSATFVTELNYRLKEVKGTCINLTKSIIERIDKLETKTTTRCLYADATADKLEKK